MQVFWGEFIDASSSMLLLVLEAFIMFEIPEKFIPSSLLLLLFICFLFKTFMIVLSEFASLWQVTRPFFVKFISILQFDDNIFKNNMKNILWYSSNFKTFSERVLFQFVNWSS